MDTSVFPSIKPAQPGENQYYVNLLNMYLPLLQKKLNVLEVTAHLASAGLLPFDELGEVQSKVDRDRKGGVIYLMKRLVKSKDPDWFSKFKIALNKSGQQIFYKLLNEEDVGDEDGFERILLSHFAALTETIKPIQLLPELYQRQTITKMDMEEITSETKNHGNSRGAYKLLTTISCRKNGWFTDFVAALKKENYRPILNLFGPNFSDANSDESIDRYARECVEVNRPLMQSERSEVNQQEVRSDKLMKDSNFSAAKLKDVTMQGETPSKSMKTEKTTKSRDILEEKYAAKPEFVTPVKSALTYGVPYGIHDSETSPEIVDLRTDDEFNSSSLCEMKEHSASSHQMQQFPTSSDSSKRDTTLNADRGSDRSCNPELSMPGASGLHAELDLRSDIRPPPSVSSANERTSGPMNQLSQTSPHGSNSRRMGSLPASANVFDSTLTEADISDTLVEKQTLQLRGYQKELAEPAISGKNCIIVAPTGSGKTHVALFISKLHLDCLEEDRKVLFFVPKVALVQQQKQQYLTYMDDNCSVTSVCGERDMQMTLSDLIKTNDVIVLTPQILVNAIESKEMDDSFSQFSLMIFDECHHAMKDHPYNKIMSRYNDILLSGDEERIRRLPQVIGLTASPGVGKAKNDEAAIDHILKLCANLAGSDICTVTKRENLEELQNNVNTAVEGIEDVRGRVNDPFSAVILKIMTEIENKMRNREDVPKLVAEVPNILKVLQPPAQRGHDSYTQFLAHLKREVAKIYGQETRRFFLSCQEHLEVYNNALLINADCRTVEALNFIKSQFSEMNSGRRASLPSNEVDRWLNDLFTNKEMILEEMSRGKDSENPKLKYLEQLILGFYRENPNSQGIIFCKTRFMTDALVKWIKETETLKHLNPHNLVGAGSTVAKGNVSMTHHKLDDVLKYFKDGIHKIIVATSVAEEGLDVKSCNYVIRYEHVTNDIARVQSRGRARAADANYLIVGERDGGVAHREVTNQIREELMIRAIYLVHQLSEEDFKSRILLNQQSAKQEREMNKLSAEHFRQMRSREDDFQLRCFKCDSMGVWCSDLRTIKESHHVVIDPEFKDRISTENHPRPKRYDDFEKKGKIRCKKCDYDWGISALYKNVPVYLLKVCSFVVEDQDHNRYTYKKWKEVPFRVNEMMSEDMKSLVSVFNFGI